MPRGNLMLADPITLDDSRVDIRRIGPPQRIVYLSSEPPADDPVVSIARTNNMASVVLPSAPAAVLSQPAGVRIDNANTLVAPSFSFSDVPLWAWAGAAVGAYFLFGGKRGR